MKSKEALISWCETTTTCNQREGVGIARIILSSSQVSGSPGHRLVIAWMKMIRRLQCQGLLQEVIDTLFGEHDQALEIAWLDMRKDRGTIARFVEEYNAITDFVLQHPTLTNIMNEAISWTNVSSELEEVVGTTLLGKRLFNHAMQEVSHSVYTKVVACCLLVACLLLAGCLLLATF